MRLRTYQVHISHGTFSIAYPVVHSHGLGLTAVQGISSVHIEVSYYGACLEFRVIRQMFLIKLSVPLYFYSVAVARNMFHPRKSALVPFVQLIPFIIMT